MKGEDRGRPRSEQRQENKSVRIHCLSHTCCMFHTCPTLNPHTGDKVYAFISQTSKLRPRTSTSLFSCFESREKHILVISVSPVPSPEKASDKCSVMLKGRYSVAPSRAGVLHRIPQSRRCLYAHWGGYKVFVQEG